MRLARRLGRPDDGFTMIEVLIALVVLSVALGGMIPMLVQTIRGNHYGAMTSKAATYSHAKLEELRSLEIGQATASGGPLELGSHSDSGTLPTGFTRAWQVSDLSGGAGRLLGIEVVTTWTDRDGGAHSHSFYTIRGAWN